MNEKQNKRKEFKLPEYEYFFRMLNNKFVEKEN